MIGGLIRFYGRTENMVYLREGETARLSNEYEFLLNSLEYPGYENGRPKDWYSKATVLPTRVDGCPLNLHPAEMMLRVKASAMSERAPRAQLA
jgi:hypothetical protein